jgi:hypothetical protein
MRTISVIGFAALAVAGFAAAQPEARAVGEGVRVAFVEPDPQPPADALPCYRRIADPARAATLARFLDNEAARWAIGLYARARSIAVARGGAGLQPAEYTIAFVPGGDSSAVGFRLRTEAGIESHPRAAYIRLGPEAWRFSTMLLHETGHVALAMLAGGREVPRREIAAIPHTVAALTDRGTAFDEGFAISLETLIAQVSAAPDVRRTYRHDQFLFGPAARMRAEYYRPSADLLTFAQEHARYEAVRDDAFAFASAFKQPDYLRAQIETARDFATVRDADQLLASEGFYASFFFSLLVRGDRAPSEDLIRFRQDVVMTTLAEAFATMPFTPEEPFLLHFLTTYKRVRAADWGDVLDVFLDLSHGVFVDANAASLWRGHYLAALGLDLAHLDREGIDAARSRWHAAAAADPKVLYGRLGPQLRCEVAGQAVKLAGLDSNRPLSLDVNTAEEGVIRLVPGITDAEVASWLAQRALKPFASIADFRKRSGLSEKSLSSLEF